MGKEYKQFFREVALRMKESGLLDLRFSIDTGSFGTGSPYRAVYILKAEHRDGYTKDGYINIKLGIVGFHAGKPLPLRNFASCSFKLNDDLELLDYSRGVGFTYVETIQQVFNEFLFGIDQHTRKCDDNKFKGGIKQWI